MSGVWYVTKAGQQQWVQHPLYGNPSGPNRWLCACRNDWLHEWAETRCERCGRFRPLKRWAKGREA